MVVQPAIGVRRESERPGQLRKITANPQLRRTHHKVVGVRSAIAQRIAGQSSSISSQTVASNAQPLFLTVSTSKSIEVRTQVRTGRCHRYVGESARLGNYISMSA